MIDKCESDVIEGEREYVCFMKIELLPLFNHCGFVWTRVQVSEPWLYKSTIRRRVMLKMFGEVA
ncbi:hypothetical protein QFZ80_006575 [Paenibacillus sp. V4I7]|nr:hypothetical protein [Paenibacillus sp. V4I7]